MWAIVLAIVAVQLGLGYPVRAEDSPASDRLLSETLPLFEKNGCAEIRDPADQLFCGDPELNDAAARLTSAIESRLNRLTDRRIAIEENAGWIGDRNSSCGIFGKQAIPSQEVRSVRDCLLKETEERTAILVDPNFDCLAANTTASTLICSAPSLAAAEMELNSHMLGLIAKLKENDASEAFAETDRGRDSVGRALSRLRAGASSHARYWLFE